MEKLLVLSDIHGNVRRAAAVVTAHTDCTACLFLGDGTRHIEYLRGLAPHMAFVAVRGNCDAYSRSDAEENLLFNADGVRIFMTHGHRYNVKLGYESLANAAHFSGAQLALFGHTHRPFLEEDGGVWYMNPGAARSGHYGVIEITDGTFTCELKELPE